MRKNLLMYLIGFVVILIPMFYGFTVWDSFPDQMVIHFALSGAPNGWCSKTMAIIGLPFIVFSTQLLLIVSYHFAKGKVIPKGLEYFSYWIMPIISILLNYIIYAYAFGKQVNVFLLAMIITALIYIIIGNYLPKYHRVTEFSNVKIYRTLGWSMVLFGLLILVFTFLNYRVLVLICLFIPFILNLILFLFQYFSRRKKYK